MPYGDSENVLKDARILTHIIDRQGTNFALDVLAEKTAINAQNFTLNDMEKDRIINDLTQELKEALLERI